MGKSRAIDLTALLAAMLLARMLLKFPSTRFRDGKDAACGWITVVDASLELTRISKSAFLDFEVRSTSSRKKNLIKAGWVE